MTSSETASTASDQASTASDQTSTASDQASTASDQASTASVQTSEHEGVLVAVISGELDMISVDAIGTALFDHLAKHPDGLVVELAVDFMGSSALSMLLELHARSQREGVGFAIVAVQAAALRPMMASALSQVLPVSQSVDEALKVIRKEPEPGPQPAQ